MWTWQIGFASDALSLTLSVCLGLTVFHVFRCMTYRLRAPRIDYLCTFGALMAGLLMFVALELLLWGE
jgi:hypothetical protein